LVDFDADGYADILSGSWPGELYLFRGSADGRFADRDVIKDRKGQPIKVGSASVAFAADWDADGDLDLLVGNISGEVYLVRQEGSGAEAGFGQPTKLEAAGTPIRISDGDAGPIAADWDGDGRLDLLAGAGDGSVVWFRNGGTAAEPKLEAAQTLLPAGDSPWREARGGDADSAKGPWGMRAKVCATDWNGDGRLDLLLGDFAVTMREAVKLSDEERAAAEEAQKQIETLIEQYVALAQELEQVSAAPDDETADQKKQRTARQSELEKQTEDLLKKFQELQEIAQKGEPHHEYHGYVWLLLRQGA
jgi:hypothetical protein